ncbi:MAG TPA: DNRLRE domain-containing protein [Vicinamibacterales bacterium]|nr:DNRLRE domain-containing protein [Vicinamibacterales bacterium]
MFDSFGVRLRSSVMGVAAAVVAASVMTGTAAAQTTVVLNQGGSQVTDTTLRGGTYANTNYDGQPLITRRSWSDLTWERRAILKFDTQNTIPSGAQIASATLTLTVRSGLGTSGASRPMHVYRVTQPFQEADATWRLRQGTSYWATAGGDISSSISSSAWASNVAGARVSFDVTSLVQQTVDGDFSSRYTRMLIADGGTEGKDSYREFYSSEDSTISRRPTLTVVLAGATSAPSSGTTTSTLKVLQWNIAQGYGTDGRSNISRVVDFIASKRPDVISFNEIMKYSSSSQPQQIADALRARTGQTWSWHWIQKWGASSGEGECVMTRFPIEASDDYLLSTSRSVAMVRINVNGRMVNVFSTHLDHQSSSTRLTQVRQLVAWADNFAEQRIVAGDFNSWPGTTEINEMGRTYYDGWAIARSKGVAYSFSGNPDGNTRNTRIDYVWYSRGATYLNVTRAEVFDTRDSSGYKPSDHNPLIVTFQVR